MFTSKTAWLPIPWAFFITLVLFSRLLFASSQASSPATSLPAGANSPIVLAVGQTAPPSVSGINPAPAYCESRGGNVTMRTRGDGRAYGLCEFTDNRACEEWALFHRECPIGGVRITGLDTIAQDYCAWLGGETLAVPHATCTLPNGKVCDDDALYDGRCELAWE